MEVRWINLGRVCDAVPDSLLGYTRCPTPYSMTNRQYVTRVDIDHDVWCAGEEWCPVTTTADLIGKKWHPVIIHRFLEHGPSGFNDLKSAIDGISGKVLSESLDDLENHGLVRREVISEKPFRVEYSLTDHGGSLEPVIDAMWNWGRSHLRREVNTV